MSDNSINKFEGFYLTSLIFKYRKFILAASGLAAIVSVVASLMMPKWYTATTNVVPPQTSMSGLESAMGNISSALKDFGLSKMGGSSGGGYSLTVIFDSRSVKDSIINKFDLRRVYEMEEKFYEEVLKKFESNLDITTEKEGNYLVSITDKDPQRAADMANEYVRLVNHFASDVYKREQKLNREYMEKRLGSIDSTIEHISEKLAVLSETSLMFSPLEQARAISTALVELKAQVYQSEIEYDITRSTYGENDASTQLIKKFLDESRKKLDEAMNKPGFAGNFSLDQSGRVGIEYTKLFTEIEALSKAKAFLVPIYEKSKLEETKNLENLLVLDTAIPPTKKSKPKRIFIVLGSIFGVFVLSVLTILLVHSYKDFKRKYDNLNL